MGKGPDLPLDLGPSCLGNFLSDLEDAVHLPLHHICNIYYLLLMLYSALVLFLGWTSSIERVVSQPLHLFLSPRGVIVLPVIEELLPCILLCDLIGCCSCTLEVEFTSVKLCNSFLRVNVILKTKVSCIAFHSSRSVRSCEPTIC